MRLPDKTIVIVLLVLVVAALVRCSNPADHKVSKSDTLSFSNEDVVKGQSLAAANCQTCHKLPDPALLDKVTWRDHLLPAMGRYLGVNSVASTGKLISPTSDDYYLPARPVVDSATWARITVYYITKAPEHLPVPHVPEPIHNLPFFEIQATPAEWILPKSLTSYVKIDESVTPHRLIISDGMTNRLIVLNNKVQTLGSSVLDGPIVDLLFQKSKITATTIGNDLWANNFKNGSVGEITINKKGVAALKSKPVFEDLSRPLSANIADLNGDGKPDYLVAQFGKMVGRLSWFEQSVKEPKEHVLRDKPGCIKVIIDHSKGKLPDVWALFAQGDEGVFLYTNDGKGNFEEKEVLSFPPSYGSSSFDLVDFNGDGFKDIIYTCGDNGDYSQILKPYHGVYIYLNDGKNNFTQKYFYPVNGCYKAIAKDFDGDGDLDIAAISEFPGSKTPWEAFVYLENKGNFNFQAFTLPLNTPFHNGMTMDAADIDGDGKTDLLLGNGYVPTGTKSHDKQPLFLVLKNKTSAAVKP
ncbi:VCBS repeat-containing protein [Mucilaginibacter corticis]|uniref:VCBS repeat-containing protein n=1 Tax=Mucilaginibacter corticis TaxID=2597670 RepID=A0A556MSI6_9SPHI|nr:VCBS repeat-containing protein [Mucilaginibacter corticis]TSJ42873.1 VCBS repeat-containing protein [Mucilaginibacter corticis]